MSKLTIRGLDFDLDKAELEDLQRQITMILAGGIQSNGVKKVLEKVKQDEARKLAKGRQDFDVSSGGVIFDSTLGSNVYKLPPSDSVFNSSSVDDGRNLVFKPVSKKASIIKQWKEKRANQARKSNRGW